MSQGAAMTVLIKGSLLSSLGDSLRLGEDGTIGCPSRGHPEAWPSNKVRLAGCLRHHRQDNNSRLLPAWLWVFPLPLLPAMPGILGLAPSTASFTAPWELSLLIPQPEVSPLHPSLY